ncbi:hypothetical protein BCR42DRAFT_386836 [Absidia repens]|uniref:histone deacetylase n=1 Tax=Absidia repens TaxID=90262 RepID=A0A1X2IXD2_9FUNG|nr:hypothetical protein BCR42DRAFT_386836 [Absidia repens]
MTTSMIRMGMQVDAWKQDLGDFYRARIVEMDDSLIFIHYEGFPPDQADWIHLSDIRRPLANNNISKPNRQHSSINALTASTKRRRKESLQQIDDPNQHQQRQWPHLQDEKGDGDDQGGGKYGPKGRESPLSWKDYATFYYTQEGTKARHHTGLVQDRRMALHSCPCHSKEFAHPERPDRLSSILQQLHNERILRYVKHLHGREATPSELSKAHTIQHIHNYTPPEQEGNKEIMKVTSIAALLNPTPPPKTLRGIGGGVVTTETTTATTQDGYLLPSHRNRLLPNDENITTTSTTTSATTPMNVKLTYPPDLVCQMACGELGIAVDTTFHPSHSSVSAKVAAGSLITLVDAIVQGQLHNGFALVRPPGHHAEDDAAMGFCFFNNVAVAALSTLDKYPTQIKKILIIDWDIHHGNGTQKIFYDHPNVLYISIHRWDHGEFYPHTGAPDECGVGDGVGRNVNIALSDDDSQSRPMGDPEFVAAFYHIIVPIARQFNPDMIFVSAGFDAAAGHPENLGGYIVTPRGFSLMTKLVMDLAQELCDGKLVLTLEGGYALQPLAVSAAASVAQLLRPTSSSNNDDDYRHTLNSVKPNQGCVTSLAKCIQIQQSHWQFDADLLSPSCRFHLPLHWHASEAILTRPKRDKRPIKVPMVEGY